jgi:hypothetical protein
VRPRGRGVGRLDRGIALDLHHLHEAHAGQRRPQTRAGLLGQPGDKLQGGGTRGAVLLGDRVWILRCGKQERLHHRWSVLCDLGDQGGRDLSWTARHRGYESQRRGTCLDPDPCLLGRLDAADLEARLDGRSDAANRTGRTDPT